MALVAGGAARSLDVTEPHVLTHYPEDADGVLMARAHPLGARWRRWHVGLFDPRSGVHELLIDRIVKLAGVTPIIWVSCLVTPVGPPAHASRYNRAKPANSTHPYKVGKNH